MDLDEKNTPYLVVTPIHKTLNFEVILFHGASPFGEEHPSMINLALALANSGIKVYIPRLPKLTELELHSNTIDLIAHYYLYIKSMSSKNIVPAGISFGGGLLMKAMVKDKINDKLPKSILTYGTYYSLESSINFLISGVNDINGIHGYVKPNVWGLIVLFHNYIAGIEAGFDTRDIQKILKLRVLNKVIQSPRRILILISSTESKWSYCDHWHTSLTSCS